MTSVFDVKGNRIGAVQACRRGIGRELSPEKIADIRKRMLNSPRPSATRQDECHALQFGDNLSHGTPPRKRKHKGRF